MSFDMREVTMNGRGQGKFADSLAFEILRQRDDLYKRVNELEEQLEMAELKEKTNKIHNEELLSHIERLYKVINEQPIYLSEIEIENLNDFRKVNGGYYDSVTGIVSGIGVKLVAKYKDKEKDITDYTNW